MALRIQNRLWRVVRGSLPWQARWTIGWLVRGLPPSVSGQIRWWIQRDGRGDAYEYTRGVFERHYQAYRRCAPDNELAPQTVLEMGVGDSLALALCWSYAGTRRYVAFDVEDHASRTPWRACCDIVRRFAAEYATTNGGDKLGLHRWARPEVLAACERSEACRAACLDAIGIEYVVDDTLGSCGIADGSVEFAFAHAVFEHIPEPELPGVLAALARALAGRGALSVQIDLRDHRATSPNANWMSFLAFDDDDWERVASTITYTNRLRHSEWLRLFTEHGFEVIADDVTTWEEQLPLRRRQLSARFRRMSDDDLRITECHIVLRPDGAASA